MGARLADKVCLITGAGGGIGRAAAQLFAREGARIVGCDLHADSAEETQTLVRRAGGEMVSLHPCDLTRGEDRQALVEFALRSFGRIDVLFNNAAMAYFNWLEDVSEAEWKTNLDEELSLVFLLTKSAWPHLKASGGVIVNTASATAWSTFKTLPSIAHSTAKAGVVAMTRHLAMEGAPHGVRANSISPGVVETNQTRAHLRNREWADYMMGRTLLGRPAQPSEIASAALFLASDESSYVTGIDLVVDGGLLTT